MPILLAICIAEMFIYTDHFLQPLKVFFKQ